MKLPIFTTEGKDSGDKAELADSIFGIEPNETAIYEDVRRYMANQRQGTSNTKERGQVRGGGRKAYRQKGTGRARRGSGRHRPRRAGRPPVSLRDRPGPLHGAAEHQPDPSRSGSEGRPDRRTDGRRIGPSVADHTRVCSEAGCTQLKQVSFRPLKQKTTLTDMHQSPRLA